MFNTTDVQKSSRIPRLVKNLYAHMPVIESARAKLVTESYQATEGEPIITRRAKAFAHILRHIPIIIRDEGTGRRQQYHRTERLSDFPGIFLPVAGG